MPAESQTIRPDFFSTRFMLDLFGPFLVQGGAADIVARSQDQLRVPKQTALVIEAVQQNLEEIAPPRSFEDDPLARASLGLSLPFLASFARLGNISPWPNYLFNARYPNHATSQMREDAQEVTELLQKDPEQFSPFETALMRRLRGSRRLFSYFVMDELMKQQGIDIQADFTVPLKLFETNIDWEMFDPSLENRVRGIAIPRSVREMRGWLDFAGKARAAHSIVSALIPLYQWIAVTNGYHMGIITNGLEEAFDVRLAWDGKQYHLLEGTLEGKNLPALAMQHPVLNAVHAIIEADGGLNMFTVPEQMKDFDHVSNWAYSSSVELIDPAVSRTSVFFPDIEMVKFDALQLPHGTLYRFNQTLSANAVANQLYKQKKERI